MVKRLQSRTFSQHSVECMVGLRICYPFGSAASSVHKRVILVHKTNRVQAVEDARQPSVEQEQCQLQWQWQHKS